MIYSESKSCWCVRPTTHTNLIDVQIWCYELFGKHRIENVCDGIWSWCDGEFYGIKRTIGNFDISVSDKRPYFSFKNESDALMFQLRWT